MFKQITYRDKFYLLYSIIFLFILYIIDKGYLPNLVSFISFIFILILYCYYYIRHKKCYNYCNELDKINSKSYLQYKIIKLNEYFIINIILLCLNVFLFILKVVIINFSNMVILGSFILSLYFIIISLMRISLYLEN